MEPEITEKRGGLYCLLYIKKTGPFNMKLYVGYSCNLIERIESHQNDKSIIRFCILSSHSANLLDEDLITTALAIQFGPNNVEGGSYTGHQAAFFLTRKVNHICNRCFTCGGESHFAIKCPGSSQILAARKLVINDIVQIQNFMGSCLSEFENWDSPPQNIYKPEVKDIIQRIKKGFNT